VSHQVRARSSLRDRKPIPNSCRLEGKLRQSIAIVLLGLILAMPRASSAFAQDSPDWTEPFPAFRIACPNPDPDCGWNGARTGAQAEKIKAALKPMSVCG